jgi:chain length determinant protein tyrosine kinase EpsG
MAQITEIARPSTYQAAARPGGQIGAMLIDSGKISAEDAERIFLLQKTQGLRFGEAAVRLGLVTESEINAALATQFEYPYLHSAETGVRPEVVAAYEPFSRQVERLRAVRSQLMLRWFSPDQRVIAVASARSKDGRSYIAANLAVVFSQLGERTLLIDADMRRPRQHELFNLPNQVGLSTALSGRDEGRGKRVSGLVDLSVLPSGPIPPNPSELLSRASFGDLLERAREEYDVVIVDTAAAESGADIQTVAHRTRGVLMLARKNRSRLREVQALSDSIQGAGAVVVGTVLNGH